METPELETAKEIKDVLDEAKEVLAESKLLLEISEEAGWKKANSEDVQRLLKNVDTAVEHKISIDEEGKLFITLWIKELPITQQLDMMELFMTFDKKGEAKLKWRQYYAHAYTQMVVKTEPVIKWKEARFFNKKFLKILMDYLPNPFEDEKMTPGQIDEDTQKN